MKNFSHILAIDPSGNFEEGKGTTGMCLFDSDKNRIVAVKNLSASDYKTKEDYWQAHVNSINKIISNPKFPRVVIVIEDFMLDPKRALQQSHSRMETPKLIGIIQLHCTNNSIAYAMQRPTDVKTRWADYILEYKKYILKHKNTYVLPGSNKSISRHCKDAIRHAVHYSLFKNKEI